MNRTIQIGESLHYGGLSVWPLFAESNAVDYQLADEAMAAGTMTVREVSDTGSVAELTVENNGDRRVLVLEGEEFVGAKQNRILNTSVLVPARSKIRIPVSCVEQGRWAYRSRRFGSSGASSSPSLRRILSRSVSHSLAAQHGYRSDQGAIWREVELRQVVLGMCSPTRAYRDTIEQSRDRIKELQEHLPYVAGASGFVVAVAGKPVALDLFDKPSTCEKVCRKLLAGYALDALASGAEAGQPDPSVLCDFVASVAAAPWQPVQPVGEGEAYRAETNTRAYAAKLTFQGCLVHASVLAGA